MCVILSTWERLLIMNVVLFLEFSRLLLLSFWRDMETPRVTVCHLVVYSVFSVFRDFLSHGRCEIS